MPITRLINNTEPEIHGTSNMLVVLLHGMAHGHDLSDWHEALKEFLPNADLLIPRYASYVLSNVAPRRVADQLAQYIHEAVTNRSRRLDGGEYERIILIGYSAGGLIIRKTYLIAMGYGDDDELVGDTRPLQWAKKVERIILMAAINRGISDTRPETMNWLIYGLQRVGCWDELVQHGRVQEIRNDIASADWVVGIFPGLFELLKIGDIGTAGHNGFQDDTPKKKSIPAYFNGGHGAAIQPKNHTSLAHFILTGEVKPEEKLLVAQQEAWAVLLAKLCWAIWLVIAAIAVGLGFLFIWLLSLAGISPLVAGLFYAGFVLLLLYTL